ncbi:unnamed protein product [Rotaria sp. Silwood2]|nr:unnamed protein product [Rotaria sp. Silwood2]
MFKLFLFSLFYFARINTNHSQVVHTPLQPTHGSNQYDPILNQILSTEIVINTQPSIQLSETNTIATQVPSVSTHRANVVPQRRQRNNHTAQTRQNQQIPQQYRTLPRQQLQAAHHYHQQQQQHRQHMNQTPRPQPQRQRFNQVHRQQHHQHRPQQYQQRPQQQQQRRAGTDQQHTRPWRDYSYERPSDLFKRIMQEVFVEQHYQRLLEEYLNPPLPSDLHDLPVVEENPDILVEAYEGGKMDEKLQWEQEQLQQLELEASIEPQLLDEDELEQTENIDSITRTLEEEQNTRNLQQLTSKQLLEQLQFLNIQLYEP